VWISSVPVEKKEKLANRFALRNLGRRKAPEILWEIWRVVEKEVSLNAILVDLPLIE